MSKNRKKILVGESNPVHQKAIAKTFRQIGYKVEFVTNGVTLGQVIERDWYSHIFIDSKLPRFDCALLSKQLEESELIHNAPSELIALTVNVFPPAWDEALFSSSFSKPLRADYLRLFLDPESVQAAT